VFKDRFEILVDITGVDHLWTDH